MMMILLPCIKYIVKEIDKIEKELANIDVCVQTDIIRYNVNIMKEVFPKTLMKI